MTTPLQEVQSAVRMLSATERLVLLEWLANESVEVATGIFSTPSVFGGAACIRRLQLPVWQLEDERQNGLGEAEMVAEHPGLTLEDLRRAWTYVAEHREQIERLIALNLKSQSVP